MNRVRLRQNAFDRRIVIDATNEWRGAVHGFVQVIALLVGTASKRHNHRMSIFVAGILRRPRTQSWLNASQKYSFPRTQRSGLNSLIAHGKLKQRGEIEARAMDTLLSYAESAPTNGMRKNIGRKRLLSN